MNKTTRLGDKFPMFNEVIQSMLRQYDFDLRCASPGVIREFDAVTQTVKVQLFIKELISIDEKIQSEIIPELVDVPILPLRAGNFVITLPVTVGDECLVIFGDTCIDSWHELGEDTENSQNKGTREPMSIRRHDLSDGFALLAPASKPKAIENYATDCLEIRTLDGENKIQVKDDSIKLQVTEETYIEIKEGEIKFSYDDATILTVKNGVVTIEATNIQLGGESGLQKLIDERIIAIYNAHTHLYSPGPGSPTATAVPTVPLLASACATTVTEAK